MSEEWDEDEHPRDEQGRFATTDAGSGSAEGPAGPPTRADAIADWIGRAKYQNIPEENQRALIEEASKLFDVRMGYAHENAPGPGEPGYYGTEYSGLEHRVIDRASSEAAFQETEDASDAAKAFCSDWEECARIRAASRWKPGDGRVVNEEDGMRAFAYSEALQEAAVKVWEETGGRRLYRGYNNVDSARLAKFLAAPTVTLQALSSFTADPVIAREFARNIVGDERVVHPFGVILDVDNINGIAPGFRSKHQEEEEVIAPRGVVIDIVDRYFDSAGLLHLKGKARDDLTLSAPRDDASPPSSPPREHDNTLAGRWRAEQETEAWDDDGGLLLADWNEDDHPRDDRGRFTSGGASGGGAAKAEPAPPAAPAPDRRAEWQAKTLREHEERKAARAREVQRASNGIAVPAPGVMPFHGGFYSEKVTRFPTREAAEAGAAKLFSLAAGNGQVGDANVFLSKQYDELGLTNEFAHHLNTAFDGATRGGKVTLDIPPSEAERDRENLLRYLWADRDEAHAGLSFAAAAWGRRDEPLSPEEVEGVRAAWGARLRSYMEGRTASTKAQRQLVNALWDLRPTDPTPEDAQAYIEDPDARHHASPPMVGRGYPMSKLERALKDRTLAAMESIREAENSQYVAHLAEKVYPNTSPDQSDEDRERAVAAEIRKLHRSEAERSEAADLYGIDPSHLRDPDFLEQTIEAQASLVVYKEGKAAAWSKGWGRVHAASLNTTQAMMRLEVHPVIAEVLALAPLDELLVEPTLNIDANGSYEYGAVRMNLSPAIQPEIGIRTGLALGDEPWVVGDDGSYPDRTPTGGVHSVLIHELGHHVFYQAQALAEYESSGGVYVRGEPSAKIALRHTDRGQRVSVYSATNSREFEAEAFAAYVEDAEALKARFPDVHAYVRETLLTLGVKDPDARPPDRAWSTLHLSADEDPSR